MGKIMDTIDRLLFGATAAESVAMRVRLAELQLERRLLAGLEADAAAEADESSESERSTGNGG
jgi:hypothetical protein